MTLAQLVQEWCSSVVFTCFLDWMNRQHGCLFNRKLDDLVIPDRKSCKRGLTSDIDYSKTWRRPPLCEGTPG